MKLEFPDSSCIEVGQRSGTRRACWRLGFSLVFFSETNIDKLVILGTASKLILKLGYIIRTYLFFCLTTSRNEVCVTRAQKNPERVRRDVILTIWTKQHYDILSVRRAFFVWNVCSEHVEKGRAYTCILLIYIYIYTQDSGTLYEAFFFHGAY